MNLEAAKVMKPCSELNPGVWQGDCFLGIDQNRSKMFRRPGMDMPVHWRADSHCPDDSAEFRIRRFALNAFPMRLATVVRNRTDNARRRLFRLRLASHGVGGFCLRRRHGGAEEHSENLFFGLASVLG